MQARGCSLFTVVIRRTVAVSPEAINVMCTAVWENMQCSKYTFVAEFKNPGKEISND